MRLCLIFVLIFFSCGGPSEPLSPEEKKLKQGQALYRTLCTSCHNIDPTREGSIGPTVADASLELLTAKVLHGTYPPGHKPARTTNMMTRIALTEDDLKALAAFLQKN